MKKLFISRRATGLATGGLLLMGILFSSCDKDDDRVKDIKASGFLSNIRL